MSTYPSPGRGAWTLTGGLLRAKPLSTSRVGYYRLAGLGEIPIGSAFLNRADTSHGAECVFRAVMALQELTSATIDGWYGLDTDQHVRAAQQALHLEVDGIVGPVTTKALLTPMISQIAATASVPVAILGGLLMNESSLDPGAVGVNGLDHGLAQINLGAHAASVRFEDAMDPQYAINWSAQELHHTYATWVWQQGKTRSGVDAWDIAIANHNSPALARTWAQTGTAPVVATRPFQIEEYVRKVRTAW